jgi:hypothetical protein
MTTEELAAAGLPAEPEVQDPEIAQPPEEHASPAASGSGIHKDGEIRSEEEEIRNVDADVKDLIAAKQSGPLPPSFVFGESKVTANSISVTPVFPKKTKCITTCMPGSSFMHIVTYK